MTETESLVSRACPVCDTSVGARPFAEANFDLAGADAATFSSRKLPEYMHYRLLSCDCCDVLYASPIPERKTLTHAYHQADFDTAAESRFAGRTYAAWLDRSLPRLHDRIGALDIGSSDGAFMEALEELGFFDVRGVEPCRTAIAKAPRRLQGQIAHGMFRPESYAPASFRLVSCCQTLEHVSDPLKLARDAYRLLKPGGALFLVCHNRRALSAKVLGKRSPIFDVEHLQLFSPRSLRRLLETAGFERIRVRPLINRYPIQYWAKLFPFPRRIKPRVLRALERSRAGSFPLALPAGNLAALAMKR